MPYLHREAFVLCSPARAVENLLRYVTGHAPEVARLTLHPSIALPDRQTLRVVATPEINVTIAADDRVHYRVLWQPADGGEFPRFEGSIAIATDPDERMSRLILEGETLSPRSPLATRISAATARELLVSLISELC